LAAAPPQTPLGELTALLDLRGLLLRGGEGRGGQRREGSGEQGKGPEWRGEGGKGKGEGEGRDRARGWRGRIMGIAHPLFCTATSTR